MSGARHTACKLCRDRKVRCGGEQPICEKCRRAGEHCVYLPYNRPNKVDLLTTVETLQQRLNQAEDVIRKMDKAQGTTQFPGSAALNPDFAVPSPLSLFMQPSFPSTTTGDSSFAPTPPNFPAWFHQQMPPNELPANQGMSFASPVVAMANRQEGGPFQVEDTDMPSTDLSMTAESFIPSLRQIRDLNTNAAYPPNGTPIDRDDEEGRAVASELGAFTIAVFTAQCEIGGISLVLAEYLEWMRKAPKTYDHSSMLQALESRAREVHDIARTKHYVAWKEMVSALESYRLGARLRELEGGVCRSLAELDRFFHAKYDVKSTLDDQYKSKRTGSGPNSSHRSSSVASENQQSNH